MKYMGSKRAMLGNGLGDALGRSILRAERVLDLFTGSAVVAWHVAEKYGKEVIASDLQEYSAALAASVIERTEAITDFCWVDSWLRSARARISHHPQWGALKAHQARLEDTDAATAAENAGEFNFEKNYPISKAYGGHYLSPWQSAWVDVLRASLPPDRAHRKVGLAALIQATSRCVASPGHTAQPFKANTTAGPFLIEAWRRDLPTIVAARVKDISPRFAKLQGRAYCADALQIADQARPGDLAFVDPPYSSVHYSRFYHVLETVARGSIGEVAGSGRYPPSQDRPSSSFSITTKAQRAFDELLALLARRRATVIITFPAGKASNGLSGDHVKRLAAEHFRIEEVKVSSRFSTLGGDTKHRAARQDADELILTLSAYS